MKVERTYRGSRSRRISITAILDDAFNIVRRHFRLYCTIAALVIAPLSLLGNVVTSRAVPEYATHARRVADLLNQMQLHHTVSDSDLTDAVGAWARDSAKLLALAGSFALAQFALIGSALIYAVAVAYLERPITLRRSFRAASRCAVRLLIAACTLTLTLIAILVAPATLAAAAGSSALAVVFVLCAMTFTVFLLVRCSLFAEAVVVERCGPVAAIRRSYRLTAGYFWKTCGVLLLTTIMVALMVGLAGTIVGHATNGNAVVQSCVTVVISVFTMPLVLCAQTLLYLQLSSANDQYLPEHLTAEMERLGA